MKKGMKLLRTMGDIDDKYLKRKDPWSDFFA